MNMGRGLIVVLLATVGCSSSSVVTPTVDETPTKKIAPPPAAPAGQPAPTTSAWTFDGPKATPPGCLRIDDLHGRAWIWTVAATTERVRIVAHSYHNQKAGCTATEVGATSLLTIVGQDEYRPGESGETRLVHDLAKITCGSVQLDSDVITDSGTRTTVLGQVADAGVDCLSSPPSPPTPQPPPTTKPCTATGPYEGKGPCD